MSDPAVAEEAGIGLATIVPVRHGSTIYGLLSVYYGDAADYEPLDRPIGDVLAAALAAALATMRLRRKLAKRGRRWAAEQTIEQHAEPWENALAEAIERANGKGRS